MIEAQAPEENILETTVPIKSPSESMEVFASTSFLSSAGLPESEFTHPKSQSLC